jgi:hypothetical protein
MKDGSGGYQLIGYGGDRPYRWSEPGSHTPRAIGGQAGFWVRNQQKLDAAAAEEVERTAAAARVAWRASVSAAVAARGQHPGSSWGTWGSPNQGVGGWGSRSSSLQNAEDAAALQAARAARLLESPTSYSPPDTPPQSP